MTPPPPANTVVVDARYLLPPEPMERTLEALERLAPGQHILLLLHREPFPLYQVLAQRGFTHQTQLGDDGTFAITITRAP